jgi:KDO2-lipid IV(A) lauroyltransferase
VTSLAHAAEFYALKGAVRALQVLDWSRAASLGAGLGTLGYWPLGIRRGVVEQQIAASFPSFPPEEVRRIARAAYRHIGRNAAEMVLAPRLGRQGMLDLFEQVDNWPWVESAVAAGRGIIAITGHVGNWELAGALVAARGVPIDAITRRQANPMFERYITDTRHAIGMTVVHDFEAVRRATRSLRDGRLVAFVADQGLKGLASTWVPFFGRLAKTPRGPAVFAQRLGAPMAFMAAMRLPSGRFRFHIEPVEPADTGDRERDIDETVARYTAVLERIVRQYPEQYFWHHRRWKRQPPPAAPGAAEHPVLPGHGADTASEAP